MIFKDNMSLEGLRNLGWNKPAALIPTESAFRLPVLLSPLLPSSPPCWYGCLFLKTHVTILEVVKTNKQKTTTFNFVFSILFIIQISSIISPMDHCC